MSLIRIDWNPSERKIRQFGVGLVIFSLLVAGWSAWKGHIIRAEILAATGAILGLLCTALPGPVGRPVYKAWMGVSFVIGTVISTILMALLFYGMITPIACFFRLIGRDVLRLKRPIGDSYWTELKIPQEKSYLERLF